tara:strand:+ start:60 stop:179 length:120 start_codon:yes stop_codon:yes gene_type:complete
MIKKIILLMLVSFLLVSCGKKGCPKNNAEDECIELFKSK